MTNKTVKCAVEYYKGKYPKPDCDGRDCIGYHELYDWTMCFNDSIYLVCTKQQFEDYVRESKMEKQYKSVPVTDMTIWQFGQAVSEGGEFYDSNSSLIKINDEENLESSCLCQWQIKRQLANALITTRQPLPWYEQEGVFDEAKLCAVDDGLPVFIHEYDDRGWLKDGLGNNYKVEDVKPLSPEEAAKYGVE